MFSSLLMSPIMHFISARTAAPSPRAPLYLGTRGWQMLRLHIYLSMVWGGPYGQLSTWWIRAMLLLLLQQQLITQLDLFSLALSLSRLHRVRILV